MPRRARSLCIPPLSQILCALASSGNMVLTHHSWCVGRRHPLVFTAFLHWEHKMGIVRHDTRPILRLRESWHPGVSLLSHPCRPVIYRGGSNQRHRYDSVSRLCEWESVQYIVKGDANRTHSTLFHEVSTYK